MFHIFDKANKGYINVSNFKDEIKMIVDGSMSKYPSSFNVDDIYLIFRRYDKDLDGKLTFVEFESCLSPISG